MKIKKVLVSQPKPASEKSPYYDIAEKYGVKIDFRPFIKVESVSVHIIWICSKGSSFPNTKGKKLFLKSTLEVTSFHINVTNIYGVCSTG